jgi:deoxyhypusine synthase
VYDTLEMEANLNDVEEFIVSALRSDAPEDEPWSSARLCRALGRKLSEVDEGPGILRSAFQRDVPVFIPALTDSEMGLDIAICAMRQWLQAEGEEQTSRDGKDLFDVVPSFNPFLDLQQYARLMIDAEQTGIFTIGGGVPRNWAQQVGPYAELITGRLGVESTTPRFRYAVRMCPEPVHWGGLSGCTYSEGVSWGKFVPRSEGGRFAEVCCDATAVLPLLMKAVFEEMDRESGEEVE